MDPVLEADASKTKSIVVRPRTPRSVPVHHRYPARFMRRIRSMLDDSLDNIVRKRLKVACSSMACVLSFRHIEAGSLLIEIRLRLNRIFERPQILAERTDESFSLFLIAHPNNFDVEHPLARMG